MDTQTKRYFMWFCFGLLALAAVGIDFVSLLFVFVCIGSLFLAGWLYPDKKDDE